MEIRASNPEGYTNSLTHFRFDANDSAVSIWLYSNPTKSDFISPFCACFANGKKMPFQFVRNQDIECMRFDEGSNQKWT